VRRREMKFFKSDYDYYGEKVGSEDERRYNKAWALGLLV
jgi:hypothetical protein